jgi:oligoribonuclease NrnB/cAMP/cGMP phosphodiesterase (DHH superfamily)
MSSAIVKKFRPDAVVVMTTYGHEWKQTSFNVGDSILFTDFCPNPEDLVVLYDAGIKFQVLDHHVTTVMNLDKYWEKEPQKANVIRSLCSLDMNRCGATMTWDFFSPDPSTRPAVLEYIEIADIWKWERNENAKYVTQYIRANNKMGSWEDMAKLLDEFDEAKAIEGGKILYKRLQADVEHTADKSKRYIIHGIEALVVNSAHANSISELGHRLALDSKSGCGLVYNIIGNKVKISTRGLKGTTIARELAEKLGGGGHNEAAGAFMDAREFLEFLFPSKKA